jgi:hypothetical protein
MENQHRKITGYRELDQEEIDLMNKVKALGVQIEEVLLKVEEHIRQQRQEMLDKHGDNLDLAREEPTYLRHKNATPQRFLAMAKTELQTGLMYATRAVAQPEFF